MSTVDHAQEKVTVILTDNDFMQMVERALESVVREPYQHHIVVDDVKVNIVDNEAEGWVISYCIDED